MLHSDVYPVDAAVLQHRNKAPVPLHDLYRAAFPTRYSFRGAETLTKKIACVEPRYSRAAWAEYRLLGSFDLKRCCYRALTTGGAASSQAR